jgi:type I restriction enzyme S subunit
MKMEEWKECKLGDICKSNINSYSEKDNWVFVNYLDTGNITENKISDIQFIDLSSESLPSRARRKVQINDIIYSTVRPNQKHFGIIKVQPENFLVSTGFAVLHINKTIADPNFVFYNLIQNENTESLHAIAEQTTSAYPAIKPSDIENLSINLPPLPTQQKIAAILSSLDDKIELNNKINTNLEQQAGALFKNWFVDFEPFGGKMPEGWKVGKLCDIANYSSEKIKINKLTPETYYSTENMLPSKGGIETATSLPSISQTTRCLPGETIISNIRPYFKKIFYCTEEVAGCSTDVLCFKPKNKYYSEYIYQVLYSDIFFDYMVLGSKGTKMPRGDKQQIMNYPITIPDELYLRKFKTFAKPILSQIDSNRKENKRLSELRDTLLPKLMNGEIVV